MAYFKFSIISGRNDAGEYRSTTPNGHWRPVPAARLAAKIGLVGDTSGRGGHGGRYKVTPDGQVERLAGARTERSKC